VIDCIDIHRVIKERYYRENCTVLKENLLSKDLILVDVIINKKKKN